MKTDLVVHLKSLFPSNALCEERFANTRWKMKIFCPHCKHSEKIYSFSDKRRYKCGFCRKQFTVKVGTIFSESKIPLKKWLISIYLISSNGNISSYQLAKFINVTQKTAWFILNRIYFASQTVSFNLRVEEN